MATAYISNNQLIWVSREERPVIDRLITEVCQVDSSPISLIKEIRCTAPGDNRNLFLGELL